MLGISTDCLPLIQRNSLHGLELFRTSGNENRITTPMQLHLQDESSSNLRTLKGKHQCFSIFRTSR